MPSQERTIAWGGYDPEIPHQGDLKLPNYFLQPCVQDCTRLTYLVSHAGRDAE